MITIHSGGAKGADSYFGNIGCRFGHKVIHHSFQGHSTPCSGVVIKHSDKELTVADDMLNTCNKILKRKFPTSNEFVNNLLRRNYYQVINSNAIIAIAPLQNENIVSGGTGWAVAMAIILKKPIAVFDDNQTNKWYRYDFEKSLFSPVLKPIIKDGAVIAGIGTREISPLGIKEIEKILTIKNT